MPRETIICDECGFIGPARKAARKGSAFIERMLWIVFFFPGVFYSLWRRSGRGPVCPKCGSRALTPLDTPEGEAMMRQRLSTRDPGHGI